VRADKVAPGHDGWQPANGAAPFPVRRMGERPDRPSVTPLPVGAVVEVHVVPIDGTQQREFWIKR